MNIKGIGIDDTYIKISQYADDTVLFTDSSKESLDAFVEVLTDFYRISGLATNFDKSYIFPIGSYADVHPDFLNNFTFQISNGPIQYLGICFSHRTDFFSSKPSAKTF